MDRQSRRVFRSTALPIFSLARCWHALPAPPGCRPGSGSCLAGRDATRNRCTRSSLTSDFDAPEQSRHLRLIAFRAVSRNPNGTAPPSSAIPADATRRSPDPRLFRRWAYDRIGRAKSDKPRQRQCHLVRRAVAAPQTFRPNRLKRRQCCGACGIIFRTGRWRQSGSAFLSRYLSRCSREGSRPRRKRL